MSKEEKKTFFSAGVFKIDSMSAGFPQLQEIAQKWAEDPNFYLVLVRQVSDSNYGIEFIYYIESDTEFEEKNPFAKYKKELQDKFGKGFYAWDYQTSFDDNTERVKKQLIRFKPLEIN